MNDFFKKLSKSLSSHGTKRPALNNQKGRCGFSNDDFIFEKVVGAGSFGRVFRARLKGSSDTIVAVKRLTKADLIKRRQVTHINCERSILLSIQHPLIVQCLGSYKDDKYIFLVLEYVGGAEFFTYLRKKQKLPEEHCKFYAACIILTWEYLHSKEIVFRDLKPENLLIDNEGYMKVTDFGFAKLLPKGARTTTMCGTPDYMAPEILKGDRYSFSVDWWALGVLIYEMLFGMPPFTEKDNKGTYSKILTGLIRFPRGASALARGCMKRLLTHDPERRSGYIDWNQQSSLRQHPWLEDVSFKSLLSRRTQPPWEPPPSAVSQATFFDTYPDDHAKVPAVTGDSDPFKSW